MLEFVGAHRGTLVVAAFVTALSACGDDAATVADSGQANVDAGVADAGSHVDAGAIRDAGAESDAGIEPDAGIPSCSTDSECATGREWCEHGTCVPCDNSGLACYLACQAGWTLYERNGCYPCDCAPEGDCVADADCPEAGQKCWAGLFCWDWCPADDPSCCFGNLCAPTACGAAPPVGCLSRGCPAGQRCDTATGCASSACTCDEASATYACTPDCGGGTCVPL